MANKPDDPQFPAPRGKPDRKKPQSDIIEGIDTRSSPSEPKPKKAAEPTPSEESIDLGAAGEGMDMSGISVIEWASLVEGTPSSGAAPPAQFDSPSDVELLAKLGEPKHPAAPPPEVKPTVSGADDLATLLATPIGIEEPAGATGGTMETSAVNRPEDAAPPAPAPGFPPVDLTLPPPSLPTADFEEDAIFADGDGGSAIDLSGRAPPAAAPPPAPAGNEEDSAIDLSEDAFVFADVPAPPPAAHDEDAIDLSADAVLVKPPSGPKLAGSDDVIDLGGGESGILVAEEYVEESAPPARPAAGADSAIDYTANNDDGAIDFLAASVPDSGRGSKSKPPAVVAESGVALTLADIIEDAPRHPAAKGDSAVDLGASDDAGIDLLAVPSSGSGRGSKSKPPGAVVESGVGLTLADVVEDVPPAHPPAAKGDSAIDLTGDDAGIDLLAASGPTILSGSKPPLAPGDSSIVVNTEDIILEQVEAAGPPKGPHASGDSDIDLMTENVVLEEAGPKSGSRRDLIAEGLESGEGLTRGKKTEAVAGEDALEEFLATAGSEDPSSSVDLGSAHTIAAFKEEKKAAPRAGDSSIRVEQPARTGDEMAGIDLETIDSKSALGKRSGAGLAGMESGVNLDMSHVVSDDETVLYEPAMGASLKRGAAAVDVDEMEVTADEEEAVKPKKKVAPAAEPEAKPRGRAGAWIGGTVIGAILGTAACLGVWAFGVEPPQTLREVVGTAAPEKKTASGTSPGPAVGPAGFAGASDHIKNGDLDKVGPADLARVDETKSDQLVARAWYHWLSYLKSVRGKDPRAALSADAEPVKKALADLDKAVAANDPEALLLRGQIHELTGKAAEAKKDYEKGVEQFKDKPSLRARFETALTVLDLTPKVAHLAPAGMHPRLLALMLVSLQAVGEVAPAAPAVPEEAGYRFWQALKLARDGKWPEALKALEEARARHDQRRFLLPRKPQNPQSDPRQDIFLRAADQMKDYWTLLAQLKNPSYLTADPKDRSPLVDALLKKNEETALAAQLKDLGEKLAKDKPAATVADLVKLVKDEQKASADKIAGLETKVDDQGKMLKDVGDKLTKTTTDLASSENQLKASMVREKDLQCALASATSALQTIGEVVGFKFVDLKTSREDLLHEVRETKRIARIIDPKGTIRRLERELAVDRATLKERWTPVEMLTFWLPILQKDRSRGDLGGYADLDAGRVLANASATQVQRGRALTIRGLALRNDEKFDQARPWLEKAKTALAKTALAPRPVWLRQTEEALEEVANPAASLGRRADALAAQNKQAAAIALLDKGIRAAPAPRGALYAQRALLALESARSNGAVRGGDPLIRSARRDADEAVREGLAEGHYVSGRLSEELGQIDEAVRSYRAAVAAHPARDEAGARYRVALARALVKSRAGETPGVRPVPPPVRIGKAWPAGRTLSAVDLVSLLLVVSFQAPDLPLDGPKVREAERLADEILAMGDKAPFDARAQALAVKGLYTRAVQVYTNGLREKGLLAPAHANALLELVGNHPVLKRPDALAIPDPMEGERRYSAGLNFYFGRRYADAEKEFLSAVENDNGDARYYYFLGLARLAQGNRDGYEDFDQAARLERRGRPDRATVSKALERVQGPLRSTLNEARNRPAKDRAR